MEMRWDNPHQESPPPYPPEKVFDRHIEDEQDPTLRIELAIEWAHLGGD